MPSQALPPQAAPRRHHLGGDPALRRRGHRSAQGLQGQRELVVLGQRQRVVDAARLSRNQLTTGLGDRLEGVGPDHRRGAGQDEHPVQASGHHPLVPRELVALELADQTTAVLAVEEAADRHQVRVLLEEAERHVEEVPQDRGVRLTASREHPHRGRGLEPRHRHEDRCKSGGHREEQRGGCAAEVNVHRKGRHRGRWAPSVDTRNTTRQSSPTARAASPTVTHPSRAPWTRRLGSPDGRTPSPPPRGPSAQCAVEQRRPHAHGEHPGRRPQPGMWPKLPFWKSS